VRLCQRDRHLRARGPHAHQVVVAIARARLGLLWAMAQPVPCTTSGHQPHHHDTHHSGGLPLCIGSDAAPVWCHPRRRDETGRHPRASSEAGTLRTHVRWDPTQGYPQAPPSSLTGSVASDGSRDQEAITMQNTSQAFFPSSCHRKSYQRQA
jgi:hypothetical protein